MVIVPQCGAGQIRAIKCRALAVLEMNQVSEGVDLERHGNNLINVAWTEPGEWLTYTVENTGKHEVQDVSVKYAVVGASNGMVLAVDLKDPSDCTKLKEGDDEVGKSTVDFPGVVMLPYVFYVGFIPGELAAERQHSGFPHCTVAVTAFPISATKGLEYPFQGEGIVHESMDAPNMSFASSGKKLPDGTREDR